MSNQRTPTQAAFDELLRTIDDAKKGILFNGDANRGVGADETALIKAACEAHDELVDFVDLLVRSLNYQIKSNQLKGDEEGARLKMVTRNQAEIVLAKARGES